MLSGFELYSRWVPLISPNILPLSLEHFRTCSVNEWRPGKIMCFLLNHGEREMKERSYYKLERKCLQTRNVYVATDLLSSDEPFGPLFILWFQCDCFFKGIDWPGVKHKLFVTDHLSFQLIRIGQNYVHFGDTLWWLVMRFIPRHFSPKANSLLVHVLIFLLVLIPIINQYYLEEKKMSIYSLWVNFCLLITEMAKCVKRV